MLVFLTISGLAMGSFVNALVWRLRHQEKARTRKQRKKLSILNGRSMCPQCHRTLGFWDLIPVFSWIYLRGKCRYCHRRIGWQYPVVELTVMSLFVFSYALWPYGFAAAATVLFAAWLLIVTVFVAMFIYDLRWMILPDKLTYALLVLSIISLVFKILVTNELAGSISAAAIGFLCLGGFFYILFQISNGRWIGGGDVKLGFGLGIMLGGPLLSLTALFTASLLGTLVALVLACSGRQWRHRTIPFGPLLIAAAFLAYLYSPDIRNLAVEYLLIEA